MAREDETARYRQAAQTALDQLDWCVDYLRGIRKIGVSKALATNHAAISQRLQDSERGAERDRRRRPAG